MSPCDPPERLDDCAQFCAHHQTLPSVEAVWRNWLSWPVVWGPGGDRSFQRQALDKCLGRFVPKPFLNRSVTILPTGCDAENAFLALSAAICWRRGWESNPRIKVLQTSPLPLGYRAPDVEYIETSLRFQPLAAICGASSAPFVRNAIECAAQTAPAPAPAPWFLQGVAASRRASFLVSAFR
jgi:hypothetical protein